jgi:hypothetical protein
MHFPAAELKTSVPKTMRAKDFLGPRPDRPQKSGMHLWREDEVAKPSVLG